MDIEKEDVNNEYKKRTFDFFKNNNIDLPIPVKNAIEDAFDENDFVQTENGDDVVNIYFKEDLEDFLRDTTIYRQLNVQVMGGNSSCDILDPFVYYGDIDFTNAINENINLYNGEEEIKNVSNINAQDTNKLADPNDYCVLIIEESECHMGEYSTMIRLYIYVPSSGENVS